MLRTWVVVWLACVSHAHTHMPTHSISPFWREWLRARGMGGRRMYHADMCVSLWVSRNVEITLKITDLCGDCKPHQLRVEPYIWRNYVAGKPRLLWTFTKVWSILRGARTTRCVCILIS